MANIHSLRAKPAELVLKDPITGEPTEGVITLVGAYSKKFQDTFNALADEAAKSSGRPLKRADQDKVTNKLTAGLFVSWNDEFFGEECTTEAAEKFLSDAELGWAREQVLVFINESKNFFRPAAGEPAAGA